MSIVVTGAGGFIGRHLVTKLVRAGRRVVATDRVGAEMPEGARIVVGDLSDPAVLAEVMRGGCGAVVHLATMPGGAAEADPAGAQRINVDATFDLIEAVRATGTRPRFVFASSIAVLGDPLPAQVDDDTPLAPRMIYGAHKAMMEIALATAHRRGEIDAVSARLPAVVARPRGPSGMKSAFISDVFHALVGGETMVCPVSADATIWVQSLSCCADNLVHGLTLESGAMPESRVVTLPALRVRIGDLVDEIAGQCGASPSLIRYQPDPAIEAAFGTQPPLATPAADRAGFAHDGSLGTLVSRTLEAMHVPA